MLRHKFQVFRLKLQEIRLILREPSNKIFWNFWLWVELSIYIKVWVWFFSKFTWKVYSLYSPYNLLNINLKSYAFWANPTCSAKLRQNKYFYQIRIPIPSHLLRQLWSEELHPCISSLAGRSVYFVALRMLHCLGKAFVEVILRSYPLQCLGPCEDLKAMYS